MLVYPHAKERKESHFNKKGSKTRDRHWIIRGSDSFVDRKNNQAHRALEREQERLPLKTRPITDGCRQKIPYEIS